MIHFIVATHGPLAGALLESGRMVYGELPHVEAVMLTEQAGIEGFKQGFANVLKSASEGASGVVVLCDMQSGTPWNVACQHSFSPLTQPPVAVLAGVNLPMLLQTDEVCHLKDPHVAAQQLAALTQPTITQAVLTIAAQSDDF